MDEMIIPDEIIDDFMVRLTKEEFDNLMFQSGT
jgi:hypothetical protein